jgi:endonuclease YncB( thermonuclease family)
LTSRLFRRHPRVVSINRPRRIFRSALPRSEARLLGVALGIGLVAAAGVSLAVLPRGSPSPVAGLGAAVRQLSAQPEQVAVVDAGTLRIGDQVVRLQGVEPPKHATCAREDCGAAAANTLASMVRDAPVVCRLVGADDSGRPYAVCQAGGIELNEAIIAAGWARAQGGAPTLKAAEQTARTERRGAWASDPEW